MIFLSDVSGNMFIVNDTLMYELEDKFTKHLLKSLVKNEEEQYNSEKRCFATLDHTGSWLKEVLLLMLKLQK